MLYCNGLFIVYGFGGSPEDGSFHWRAPWDLERVGSWILWPAILLSPAKRPPPPAARLSGWHGQSCRLRPAASGSTLGGWWGHREGKQSLLLGSRAAEDTVSEPRNILPSHKNLLPGAPRSWAPYEMMQTSYSIIPPSLAHHHATPAWGPSFPTKEGAVFALH